tara:strand:- start:1387 stop:2292 length:906 start_codon:yes stop_codon:yes gene_type:complete
LKTLKIYGKKLKKICNNMKMESNTHWIDEVKNGSRYGLKGEIIVQKKSKFQEIIIIKTESHGNALMLDGCWMTSDKEEKYYHECLVHPAMSSFEAASRILIIGGGDGGTARECLKYQGISQIDLVEIDREVIDLSKKYLPQIGQNSWSDEKLQVNICDGFTWVKETKDQYYDIIFIDCSDPCTISDKLYSSEFYNECKRIIRKDGIIATQSESPESFETLHIQIRNSFKKTFNKSLTLYSFVPFYPSGIWSWTFASDNKKQFLHPKYKNIKEIEKSCDIWNLNYQEGGFKMTPNKILKALD